MSTFQKKKVHLIHGIQFTGWPDCHDWSNRIIAISLANAFDVSQEKMSCDKFSMFLPLLKPFQSIIQKKGNRKLIILTTSPLSVWILHKMNFFGSLFVRKITLCKICSFLAVWSSSYSRIGSICLSVCLVYALRSVSYPPCEQIPFF